ncbi:Oidioi.mRNA.OKI2018_I69.PAR.g10800.t1.cds [Oikopleura dioica]|uniref:Oidioi.mRNA.OKI2018_I69.PAR.g10800.t1.cds n=1 Tax=Oikopleura dioica TaxID=34765 RepID=A0ABN7RW17_OIKDI|nr:Oidioi.mRNA.OKI2018_I69.PAR.g10800.t1.cds [Oikopleura dioica]
MTRQTHSPSTKMTQTVPLNEGEKTANIEENASNRKEDLRTREERVRETDRISDYPRCDSDTMPETDSEYTCEDSSRSLVQNNSEKCLIPQPKKRRLKYDVKHQWHKFLYRLGSLIERQSSFSVFFIFSFLIGLVAITYCENDELIVYSRQQKVNPGVNATWGNFMLNVMTHADDSREGITKSALLHHQAVVQAVLATSVSFFERTWTIESLCHKATGFKLSEDIELTTKLDTEFSQFFQNDLAPCIVDTPLNCFSEGEDLLIYNREKYCLGTDGKFSWADDTPCGYSSLSGLSDFSRKISIDEYFEDNDSLLTSRRISSSSSCNSVGISHSTERTINDQGYLQTTINLMAANSLYDFYSNTLSNQPLKRNSAGRQVFWTPELAAELLETFLNNVENVVESHENAFFYCPNFVQLENLNIKESFLAVTPYLMVSTGIVYFIVAVSGLSHPLLLSAIFAISNFFVFGSFTTGWSSIIINYALSAKTHAEAKLDPFISHVGGPLLQSIAGGLILGVVATFGHLYRAKNTTSMGEIFIHTFPTIVLSMSSLFGLGLVYWTKTNTTLEHFGSEFLIMSIFFMFFIICIVPKVFEVHRLSKYMSNRTREIMLPHRAKFYCTLLWAAVRVVLAVSITILAAVGLALRFDISVRNFDFIPKTSHNYVAARIQETYFPVHKTMLELDVNETTDLHDELANAHRIASSSQFHQSMSIDKEFWFYNFKTWVDEKVRVEDVTEWECRAAVNRLRKKDVRRDLKASDITESIERILIYAINKTGRREKTFDRQSGEYETLLATWIYLNRAELRLKTEFEIFGWIPSYSEIISKKKNTMMPLEKLKNCPTTALNKMLDYRPFQRNAKKMLKLPVRLVVNDFGLKMDDFKDFQERISIEMKHAKLTGAEIDALGYLQNVTDPSTIAAYAGFVILGVFLGGLIHADMMFSFLSVAVWIVSLFQVVGLTSFCNIPFNQLTLAGCLLASLYPAVFLSLNKVDVPLINTPQIQLGLALVCFCPLIFLLCSPFSAISSYFGAPLSFGVLVAMLNSSLVAHLIGSEKVVISFDFAAKVSHQIFNINLSEDDRKVLNSLIVTPKKTLHLVEPPLEATSSSLDRDLSTSESSLS